MGEAPKLKAARTINRARAEDIAFFRDIPVGNIVDAMGRTGALDAAIKPVTGNNRFCGSALPVDAGPRDNLAPWGALRLAEDGDVMLVATGGYAQSSVCGDLLVGMARNSGVVAIVTDGVVRDRSGIADTGLPVFSAGLSPNSPQKNGPGSVGLPVIIGGVRAGAGDIVCGDEDGVVVIPHDRVAETRIAVAAVRKKETSMEAAVKAGQGAPDWVSAQPLEALFTFVDEV